MLLRRFPEAVFVLRGVTRRMWCKHQLYKRKKGVALVVTFLKAAKGSDKVKKMYSYRHKIVKIQRQFRVWFHMKEARLQTLWKAMEVIGRTRVDNYYRAAKAAERQALKAMSESAGFDSTLRNIDRLSKGISETLMIKEKEVKTRQEVEAIERAQAENAVAKKKVERKMKASAAAASSKKGGGGAAGQSERLSSSKPTRGGKSKTPALRWYFKMQMNPATQEKFYLLRELLHKERHRHVLDLVEEAKRNTHVANTGGKAPSIDLDSLRAFLHAAPGSEEEKNIVLFEDEEAGADMGVKKKPAPAAKDPAAKHNKKDKQKRQPMHMGLGATDIVHKIGHHHHGHRLKVIHPRFNMFGYGILDYFKHCPISFFKGIVDGFE